MNFNNMNNSLNLIICLFIIIYHYNVIKLPSDLVNLLKNPLILLVLLLFLTFIVENKTLMFLLIILYFVIILKSESNSQEALIDENDNTENTEVETNSDFIRDVDNEENETEECDREENEEKKNINNNKMYELLNNNTSINHDNYEFVQNINQNNNIISNVTQTQLDKIQGDDYNHCK